MGGNFLILKMEEEHNLPYHRDLSLMIQDDPARRFTAY
jgi:hypothetical protein